MTLKLFLALALTVSPGAIYAATIYNDFGSGGSYNNGESFALDDVAAQAFTASATGNLLSLTFALGTSQIAATPNIVDIFVYSDASGQPGGLLESLAFDAGPFHNPDISPGALVVTVNSVTNPLLTAGDKYWVGAQAADQVNHPVNWYFASGSSDQGIEVFFHGAWVAETPQPTTPLTLEVTTGLLSTPEPANWALFAAGLAALVLMRRYAGSVKAMPAKLTTLASSMFHC
jgi:hypothetical protein